MLDTHAPAPYGDGTSQQGKGGKRMTSYRTTVTEVSNVWVQGDTPEAAAEAIAQGRYTVESTEVTHTQLEQED